MSQEAYIGAENIAHKIKKAYVGVDGKARKIKKAYIGVDGIAQQCFNGVTHMITVTGSGSNVTACLKIDNTTYTNAIELELVEGTVISCHISGSYYYSSEVIVNGSTVTTSSATDGKKTYNYIVTKNATINLYSNSFNGYGTITITEE